MIFVITISSSFQSVLFFSKRAGYPVDGSSRYIGFGRCNVKLAHVDFYIQHIVRLFSNHLNNRLHMAYPREHVHGDAVGGGIALGRE